MQTKGGGARCGAQGAAGKVRPQERRRRSVAMERWTAEIKSGNPNPQGIIRNDSTWGKESVATEKGQLKKSEKEPPPPFFGRDCDGDGGGKARGAQPEFSELYSGSVSKTNTELGNFVTPDRDRWRGDQGEAICQTLAPAAL
jgi:hypothetical protein